jgi:D-tyrosyl-tRNA(Tyr) deacylase
MADILEKGQLMRALLQRVSKANVTVDGQEKGAIGPGLLLLVCAMQGDSSAEADRLASRVARLRIFRDTAGKMNRSLLDTGKAALVVSQFTLAADTSRGNRPGFSQAAPPTEGEALYIRFTDALRGEGIPVQTGVFGADMQVTLVNDGPVTIWLES